MKINGYEFMIGADPEFFVRRGGQVVSAYGLVPGTKDRAYPVKGGAVQVDGMALEFNINPANTAAEFEESMSSVLAQITSMVPGYEVFTEDVEKAGLQAKLPKSVADFDQGYLEAQPKEAKELGCNPDFNAYTRKENPRPNAEFPFRTASGHVHIGWTKGVDVNDPGHLEACYSLVKALDLFLGVPSLVWDTEDRRRELYGQAGAFRPKPYGLEYRVLSNKWITSPLLRKLVYWNTIEAIRATFKDPKIGESLFADMTAQDIINKTKENWSLAASSVLGYSGVRGPKWYRENTPS